MSRVRQVPRGLAPQEEMRFVGCRLFTSKLQGCLSAIIHYKGQRGQGMIVLSLVPSSVYGFSVKHPHYRPTDAG